MADLVEINFDGIVGPTHNYAGLSLGNLAATKNAGASSHPRAAALQGIAKMRANLALGLVQGILLPHRRPNAEWLASLGLDATNAGRLWPVATSASAMWAANAATVSPAPDTEDGRCHLTVANLVTMPHRSHEWPGTLAQLRLAFADERAFAVHGPVPPPFGDEGAANHMRLCDGHGAAGVEIFVYGEPGGPFPARQHPHASAAIGRIHGLSQALFVQQSPEAIAAGAFHNDVVAVANERVLFTHEQAFADPDGIHIADDPRTPCPRSGNRRRARGAQSAWQDAIKSYLFNAQLLTLPGGGEMAPRSSQARPEAMPSVRAWNLDGADDRIGNGPIRKRAAGRCAPVDGQWRRPGLPQAARGLRSGDGRSAIPGRRRQARSHRRGDRDALARARRLRGSRHARRLAGGGGGARGAALGA